MSREPKPGGAATAPKRVGEEARPNRARPEPNDREVMYFAYDRLGMPMLYADLMQFRKGPLRLQRMRTLVIQGLMAERAAGGTASPPPSSPAGADEVFGDPVGE